MHPRIIVSPFLMAVLTVASPVASWATAEKESNQSHTAASDVAQQSNAKEHSTPRLQKLGKHVFPVSTSNSLAQQYINQGLNLAYGFNHAEARQAFREAARLDPGLAMAYWGQALVLGPNINAMMEPNEEPHALEHIQTAKSLMHKTSSKEQALINALEKRYSGKAEHRTGNDQAYAAAMHEVHQRFPDDPDIAMLYVESMMDLRPWGYWMLDGTPYEGTAEIVALTEDVLRRYPKHPGALHMHIHLIEPTSTPERAEKSADTLLKSMPEAGHMIHMASHIYQRVGRYADSIRSNQMAIAADESYIAQDHAHGLYPMVYYPHNIHFLWFAATSDGQSKLAIESAKEAARKIDDDVLKAIPLTAVFRVTPYWALARFGHWQEILDLAPPPSTNAFLTGSWHYVRGLALVATKQLQQAEQELAALRKIMMGPKLDHPLLSKNTSSTVLRIAPEVLAGEIAAARKQYDQAIAYLEKAVRLEDALIYTEPAEFHLPPRLALGTILLESGHPVEAETVFWEDLRRNRNNGWALYGLKQALEAQHKHDEAKRIGERFKQAWARSDVTLSAARFGPQAR